MASPMLATDLNNPDFAGAINPDSKLSVQFYCRPVRNNFQSEKEQRPIFEDKDYVKIFIPGDATNIIDAPVTEEHKQRFPMHWAHFKNSTSGEANVGTPITQWPLVSRSMAEELKAVKFFTVESVALASDAQLQSIGMKAGMSPMSFREAAKAYLAVAKDAGIVARQAAENKALQEQLAALTAKVEAMSQPKSSVASQKSEEPKTLEKPKRKYTKKVTDGDASASPASL